MANGMETALVVTMCTLYLSAAVMAICRNAKRRAGRKGSRIPRMARSSTPVMESLSGDGFPRRQSRIITPAEMTAPEL